MKTKYFHRCSAVSFLTAFVTLAVQILVFRIISAKLNNNYAFLAISITMLGFALSGVILAFKYVMIKNPRKYIHLFTYLFVSSLLLSTLLFYYLPINVDLNPLWRMTYIKASFSMIAIASLFVVPFIFSGLILGILLCHKQLPTRKIYCFDLVGSSLGALLIVFFISIIGVEKSLLTLCLLFMIGINIIFPFKSNRYKWLFIINLAVILILFPNYSKVFKMTPPVGSYLSRLEVEYSQWDPITRIEVSKFNVESDYHDLAMIGPNKDFHKSITKFLTQNNNAGTMAFHYDGKIESLKGIEETMYHAAYRATSVSSPNVLVIGVGAGMDILTALDANASNITGVEINGATHNILKNVYKDFFKHWVDDPRVQLVHDEGRHYLAKSDKLYDIIQLTGVDSYSGTMASANIFSENFLYTKEAIKLYYEKLTEQGIVNIIRLEWPEVPREMFRMLTTAVSVLRELGIKEPSKHIAIITNFEEIGTSLLIKKTPFTESEIQKLKNWAAHNPYLVFSSPENRETNNHIFYQAFLKFNNELLEKNFIKNYPVNIQPTEDDSPFFFRYSKWRHIHPKARLFKRYIIIPVLEYNVILLLSIFVLISWLFIYLPLKYLLGLNFYLKKHKRHIFIFSSLGLGYLFIEIAYMQKLGLFLGHPNFAVSIVLSSLLLSTGVGSIYYKNIIQKLKNTRYAAYCLSGVILAEYVFVLPNLSAFIGISSLLKGVITFFILFPIGLLLGIFMPQAIDQLKKISPKYVPWGWGINGIFSVISPVLAIAISITYGINFLLLCSIPFYLISGYYLSLGSSE